jgi:hypothetical protein
MEKTNERNMAPEAIPPIMFFDNPFPKKVMNKKPIKGKRGMSEAKLSIVL